MLDPLGLIGSQFRPAEFRKHLPVWTADVERLELAQTIELDSAISVSVVVVPGQLRRGRAHVRDVAHP